MQKNHITQDELRALFDYSDGQLLRKTGAAIGSRRRDGYIVASVHGKLYLLHRLIWLWHHGELPAVIDHIDCNPSNNRIENLRPASKSLNGINRSRPKRNSKTAVLGVYYDSHRKLYATEIRHDGIRYRLGRFKTSAEAHAAYIAKRSELIPH
jgi:hypothetical protein